MKMGRGNVYKQGDEVFDGIYKRNDGKRIGFLDFAIYHPIEYLHNSILESLKELDIGNFEKVFIVIYEENKPFKDEFDNQTKFINSKLKSNISFTLCKPDKIEEVAEKLKIN